MDPRGKQQSRLDRDQIKLICREKEGNVPKKNDVNDVDG